MEFENLQAIWDTQNDRPVFSMNDSRLAVGLYQQREKSRRRLFRAWFVPVYAATLFLAVGSGFVFLAFLVKTVSRMRLTDPQMTVWDGAALAGVVGAAVAFFVPMYTERRKHEQEQNVFAPSMREELERGILQLDFELSLHSRRRVRKLNILLSIGIAVFMWEAGRLNGDPAPWMMLAYALICAGPGGWYSAASEKQMVERVMQRKRPIESMLAVLNEDVVRR